MKNSETKLPSVPIMRILTIGLAFWSLTTWCLGAEVAQKPRARDLGIPFDGEPGPHNAITDVSGVEVGFVTLISGEGKLKVGEGPIRTGVTAIHPRGKQSSVPVFASWFPLNGNGEMTGTAWIDESGFLEGPVMISNTHSVGTVRDSVVKWQIQNNKMVQLFSMPVVAETWDGWLNDVNGFHVKEHHVFEALEKAQSGRIAEGNVGGGTGMMCYGFKGGTGTASRRLPANEGGFTVGVLVQANFGRRSHLMIAGVSVGKEIPFGQEAQEAKPESQENLPGQKGEQGSIIINVGTDAPLLPHQLKRLAKRAALGMARTGGNGGNGSGDIFLAFSTASIGNANSQQPISQVSIMANDSLDPLFNATITATEEAIVNTLIAAESMSGIEGRRGIALPHERLKAILKKYGRLN